MVYKHCLDTFRGQFCNSEEGTVIFFHLSLAFSLVVEEKVGSFGICWSRLGFPFIFLNATWYDWLWRLKSFFVFKGQVGTSGMWP